MKKKIIPLIVLLGTIGAQAQTGIGTYLPHGTAELEVSSTDKGMLIPRLALTDEKDVNTVKGGEYPESLLVYHTGIPTLEAGFYFWANKKWNALVSNSTLYNYIKETAKDGNVTITNEGDKNFSFTWVDKTTEKKETVSLETLVKEMETVTTLSSNNDEGKASLIYISENKDNPKTEIDLTNLLESSSDFTKFLTKFVSTASITETETEIIPILIGNKRTGVYEYYNEKRNSTKPYEPVKITVVDDVANNFETITNNPIFKTELNKYFTENPPAGGTVTYKFENDTHIFNYTDKDGKPVVLDMSKIVKDYETDTPITALTKKVGEDDVHTGEYKYESEKGTKITINVVDDVANNFDKVINNNEFKTVFNRYLTENLEGNVTYKNDTFYYTVKQKDGTFKNEAITLKQIIKENSVVANLGLTNDVNTDKVKGVFTFNNGKEGSQDVKYAETLTAITKGKEEGKDDGTNFIAYNYKDETGKNATAQITITSDVIESFEQIIENPDVIKQLNTFISGASGSVTVIKDDKGDVIIGYKNGDKPETVNLTEEVSRVQKYGKVTGVDADATNKAGAGFTYNNGKDEAGSYTESVTGFTTAITEVTLEGGKTGKSVVYNYKDEATNTQALNLTDDVAKSFETIINKDGNKEIIKDIVTETAGPGAIATLTTTTVAENTDAVKAGFKFNSGVANTEDVKFAESLTKISLKEYTVYVYKEFDPITGQDKFTYTETPIADDDLNGKVAYGDYPANKMLYENEKGDVVEIKGSDLFRQSDNNGNGGQGGGLETITTLSFYEDYKGQGPCLVYTDEEKKESFIKVSDMFKFSEKITTLEIDNTKRQLIFTNETGIPAVYQFDDVIQEPWYVAKVSGTELDKQATKNTEDIYTNGWVGIGFDRKSTAPNERLRVKGSITATNSYYADYVFESYFNGYSDLKYDYKFNDLNSVASFIRTNRHLPGITPISDLEKTDMGYSFNVSELSIQLLEKTEELFLHAIDQQKELNAKESRIEKLESDISSKESRIEKLESEMSGMALRLQALEALLTK